MQELIVIVDEKNKVIGSATRQEAQENGLWHRIVVVLVFNSQGQLYIQKRSSKAETSPRMWDHSAAGHVDAGEEPEEAAKRELREELGIKMTTLRFISVFKTQRVENDKKFNRYWYLYTCIYDGEISLQESEVETGAFINIERLQDELKSNPLHYTDGLRNSLDTYLDYA